MLSETFNKQELPEVAVKPKPVAYSLLATHDKYLNDGRKTRLKPVKQQKYVLLLLATVAIPAMKVTL